MNFSGIKFKVVKSNGKKTSTKKSSSPKKEVKQQSVHEVIASVSAEYVPPSDSNKFKLIDNVIDMQAVLERVHAMQPDIIAVDTETQGLRWHHRIIGVSFTFSETDNYYIPFRHITEEHQPQVEDFRPYLDELLNLPFCGYVFHNYKFDYHMLKKEDISLHGIVHDTMLMHYILDENSSHALKNLAEKFIDEDSHKYEKAIQDIRRKIARKLKIKLRDFGYEHIPISIMVEYACRDTYYTWLLYSRFIVELEKDEDLMEVYERELSVLDALASMEENGVKIDPKVLGEISVKLGEEIEGLSLKIYEACGEEFDLDSPKQIRELLQRKGIHTHRYTPTNQMSTDVVALRGISGQFPFIKDLLEYRAKSKLKGTYADPLPVYCDSNETIHCSYMQAVAVTGRLTCKNPSLQVLPRPVKGEEFYNVRRGFVPYSDDYVMVFIDLSQIELRLCAHYSKDELLLRAYRENIDIHTLTASEMFGTDFDVVTKEQRSAAKAINFGIIYGIGPKKLSQTLEIQFEDARDYIQMYLERYYGVANFIQKYQRLAIKYGYVKNYFGRVRRLDSLHNPNLEEWQRERGYRQAVNYVIQGSAADLFKLIMVRCHKFLLGKKTKIIMNIHDELVFCFHKEELELLGPIMRIFENWKFRVPIVAEASYSETSWGDKQSIAV